MTSTQQRAELQRRIWQIANDVRGAVDGWDFKQYVLGSLFYRFISENFASYIEGGDNNVVYAQLPDSVITPEVKYWEIGALIDSRQKNQGWGAGVIPRLARDLHNVLPEEKGFSERNIKRMLAFYREYPQVEFVPQAVAQSGLKTEGPQAAALFQAPLLQARIAASLDKLDALTNSITEGLPREIELRQKQYEYYRDLLLRFPKPQEVAA